MEAAKPSWAFGAGATRAEKGLAYAVSLFGICALVVGGHGLGWTWWQWLIGALLVHDLAGGVVANGLDTAKLFYHSPLTFTDSVFARFVHHPVGFTAIHLQPVLIALAIPGGGAAETAGRPRLCRHRDHGGGLYRLPSGARVAAGGPAAEARPRPWGAEASRPARRRGRSGRRIAGRCSVKADERTPFGCQMTGALRTTCVHSLFCRGGIPAWGTKVNASSSVFFASGIQLPDGVRSPQRDHRGAARSRSAPRSRTAVGAVAHAPSVARAVLRTAPSRSPCRGGARRRSGGHGGGGTSPMPTHFVYVFTGSTSADRATRTSSTATTSSETTASTAGSRP